MCKYFQERIKFLFIILFCLISFACWSNPDHRSKCDPLLRRMIDYKDDTVVVHCFVETSNIGELRKNGLTIGTVAGNIVTAPIPLHQIKSIASLPGTKRIEAAKICRPMLSESIAAIQADDVWNAALGPAFQGEGVIVGIVDSGIDWSHPDFIDENGQTRILSIWDQTSDAGTPPDGYEFGSEYSQAQINDEIDGTPANIVQGKDTWGHGTHVAGIAAGNGRATGNGQSAGIYKGVAPQADLIIVKSGDTFFLTDLIIDGIGYIFSKAATYNPPRPVVINLSVGGSHLGPHDGTSTFERAIDNMLLGQSGRALVVAAGNDGDKVNHFGKALSLFQGRDTLTVHFSVNGTNPNIEDFVLFDIWYAGDSDLEVTVISPNNELFGPIGRGRTGNWPSLPGDIQIDNASTGVNPFNGDNECTIRIADNRVGGILNDDLQTGTWKLFLGGLLLDDDPSKEERYDGWLYESSMGAVITGGMERGRLLAEPGNSRLTITAGSYSTRTTWPSLFMDPYSPGGIALGATSPFSSPGPTRDGRQKPDLIAPGEYVLSSLASTKSVPPALYETATDGVHWALKGTSMSAPHVTGVIALMFEADPALTASQVKGHFIQSAQKDGMTGDAIWDADRGYGKLNALEAVRLITSITEGSTSHPYEIALHQNHPNPFNSETTIHFTIPYGYHDADPFSMTLHDMQGRKVRTLIEGQFSPGRYDIRWDGRDDNARPLSSGVYIYRLTMGRHSQSKKLILMK